MRPILPIVIEILSDQVETYDLGCKSLSNSECNIPFVSEHEPTQNEILTKNKIFPEEYEPTDRLKRFEKELNKKETIIFPQEHHKVFEKYATLNFYNKDFNVFDYKTFIKSKSKNDFKSI
jgi:hypothetical protein